MGQFKNLVEKYKRWGLSNPNIIKNYECNHEIVTCIQECTAFFICIWVCVIGEELGKSIKHILDPLGASKTLTQI